MQFGLIRTTTQDLLQLCINLQKVKIIEFGLLKTLRFNTSRSAYGVTALLCLNSDTHLAAMTRTFRFRQDL